MKRIFEKLKNNRGETLIEVLASVLVISFTMTFLMVSIVTASKANKKAKELDAAFNTENPEKADSASVSVVHNLTGVSTDEIEVDGYNTSDENKYSYYFKKP